jgi:hypothetical protein
MFQLEVEQADAQARLFEMQSAEQEWYAVVGEAQ